MNLRSRFDLLSFAEKSAEMIQNGTFYEFAHSSGEFNKRELERLLQGNFFQPECNSGEWANSLADRLYSLFLEFSLPPIPTNFKPWKETDLCFAYESLERKFKDFQDDFERKELDKISYVQKLHSVKNEIEIEISNIKYYLKEFRNFPNFNSISRQDLKKDFPELDAVQNSIFYCDEALTWLADLNVQIEDEITAVKKIHESQKAHPGFQFNPKRHRRNGNTVHYFAFGIVAYKKTFEKEYTVTFDGCDKCLFTAKKIKEIPEMLRDFLVGRVPNKFKSFDDLITRIRDNQNAWNLHYFPNLGSLEFQFKELGRYYKAEFPEFYNGTVETPVETPEETQIEGQFRENEKAIQNKDENETLQRTLDAVPQQCAKFRIRTESEKSRLETENSELWSKIEATKQGISGFNVESLLRSLHTKFLEREEKYKQKIQFLETELEKAKTEFQSELERTEAVFNQEKSQLKTELETAKKEFQDELERTEAVFNQEKSRLETELRNAKAEFQEELKQTEFVFNQEKSRLETELRKERGKPLPPPVPAVPPVPFQKIEKAFSTLQTENANLQNRLASLETEFQEMKQKIPIPTAEKPAKKEKRKESWLPYITAFIAFVVYMLA